MTVSYTHLDVYKRQVPSIIFGLMGVAVLFPLTKLAGADTTNVLLGSLTMAIILLPIIIRSCEEALAIVPQTLRDASLSLGANQSQTIFKIVLPCAVPGILSGVLSVSYTHLDVYKRQVYT